MNRYKASRIWNRIGLYWESPRMRISKRGGWVRHSDWMDAVNHIAMLAIALDVASPNHKAVIAADKYLNERSNIFPQKAPRKP